MENRDACKYIAPHICALYVIVSLSIRSASLLSSTTWSATLLFAHLTSSVERISMVTVTMSQLPNFSHLICWNERGLWWYYHSYQLRQNFPAPILNINEFICKFHRWPSYRRNHVHFSPTFWIFLSIFTVPENGTFIINFHWNHWCNIFHSILLPPLSSYTMEHNFCCNIYTILNKTNTSFACFSFPSPSPSFSRFLSLSLSKRETGIGTRGGNCSPGSSRLYCLGVSQAQKAKSREMSVRGYALHSVCPQLSFLVTAFVFMNICCPTVSQVKSGLIGMVALTSTGRGQLWPLISLLLRRLPRLIGTTDYQPRSQRRQ